MGCPFQQEFHPKNINRVVDIDRSFARHDIDVMLISPDLAVDADGEVLLDGTLNYRLKAYLSTALTTHFLTPILGVKRETFQNKQFGPVPLLLSGPVGSPEIKADARQIDELKENLLRKKTQRILRNFLPEEAVFKKKP